MALTIDWIQLRGRTFRTISGAEFSVINVTHKSVVIRPRHGNRNYELSISDELERSMDAIIAGVFFPSPTELLRVGVRRERNSYVWGILHAVWQEQHVPRTNAASRTSFPGQWHILELGDMDESYVEESDEPPHIKIARPQHGAVSGEYHFGLSGGTLDGAVRVFGGEQILVFGHEGFDEMDEVSGGGWARVNARGELEGEFVNGIGRFTAERVPPKLNGKRIRK